MPGPSTAFPERTPPAFSRLSILMHWLMLALLIAVYATIQLREFYPKGSDIRDGLKAWHFTLGLVVFLLVWVRLVARARSPRSSAPPTWSGAVASAMHLALYGLMIVLPLLGWLVLSAKDRAIPFFGLAVPHLIGPNETLADRLEDLHTTLGAAGYWLIGIHAAAALFHHYALRDGTLRRMLPGVP